MHDAGYVYINIDDSWEGARDTNGNLLSNEKFPDMKALGDYVHGKGLKLGSIARQDLRPVPVLKGAWVMKTRMLSSMRLGVSTILNTTSVASTTG